MASLTSRLGCVAQRLRDASILLVALGMTLCSMAQAQTANEWTWMGGSNNGYMPGVYGTEGTFAPANIPGSRQKIPTWTDASGNIWIFGGDGYNDVWEFNPATNEWAWMAGNSFESSEQPGVYGAMGTPAAANVPGTRYGALRWVDKSGNFWLFGGVGADANGTQGDLNDLWEFSPTTLLWTWMGGSSTIPGSGGIAGVYGTLGTPAAGNYPGSRNTSATWTDSGGNFWLFAGYGYDSNDNNLTLSDLWEFNPSTLQWTWMGGSRTGNAAPIYGTLGIPAPGNIPGGRGSDPMAWVDKGGNFWLFGGGGIGANYEYGQLNDLWQFNPSTNQWTWMGGSSIVGPYCVLVNGYTNCGQSGVYGTLGTPSAANIPGARFYGSSWIDSSGNLWLFGGQGYDANGDGGYLNDLWEYDTFTGEWTWMGGSSTLTDNSGVSGVYGTLGTQAAGNSPGGRNSTSSWTDTSGNLWLFAGYGVDGPGNLSELNEVWEYQPPSSSLPAAATPSFSLAPGNYTTVQTVTISDATAGATIYYTTNGTAPTINASVYSGAIAVSSPESIEAIAVAGGYSNSAVAAAFYNVNLPIAATPTLSLATGTYIGSQTVTISDVTPGATIYYTTDGTMPNTGSAMYGGSITVSSTETLNAIAVASEYANSAVATAAYTITPLSSTSPGEWTWVGGSTSGALGVWGTLGTPAAANIPGDRQSSAQWTDSSGHFWLFGGNGADANGNWSDLNDLWEYNPATSLWTWVSGSSTTNCGSNGCFQPGVYGTKGTPASGNIPGSRQQATTWIDSSGNLWLFGGQGYDAGGNYGDLNDLWEFSPTTGEWTWVSGTSTVAAAESPVYGTQGTPAPGNMPGGRFAPASWIDKAGHLWLFGGSAYDTAGNFGALSDLWEFNPSTSQWAWIGGATTAYHPGVYGTLGTPSAANIPGSRTNALTWTDNAGNFWIFGGYGFDVNNTWGILNDLWQFNPSTNQWTWMSGSTTLPCIASGCFQTGVYGTLGTPAAGNVPGSRNSSSTWTDASGNLWLFDGFGYDSTSAYGALNELWEFNPFTNQWAWMGGSNTIGINGGAPGVYGTLGTPAAGNIPGGRYNAAAWTASNGNLWLMGGCGYNASDIQGCFNDLWEYQPSDTVSSSPAATPSFSLAPGNYTTIQILTITDATSGATIYYTTNGTAPNINSAVYSGPITISSPEAFEAMATASGYSNSAVAAAYYNVVVPVTAAPTFSLAAGGYDTPQSVTISDATPGATIYYAINGTPTTGSTVYSGPITISSTETLEAIAAFSGYANSAVASAAYTITIPAAVAPGEWTWVGGKSTVGSSQGYPGVYGTLGTPAPGNIPGARSAEVSWTDKSGNLWLFGGLGFDVNGGTATKRLNDVWMLSPLTNEWTWMGGSTTNQAPGVCGTMGTPAAGNIPGARYSPSSWTDSSGNFWLFGGSGYDCNGNEGPLSDLWEFNPTTNLWTWVGGSSTNTHAGVYGTLGAPAVGNIPGSRENGMSWVDSSGNLWLFGGQGLDSTSSTTKGYLNDLWMFNPQTKLWTWMGGSNVDGNIGSTVEPTPGVYGTMGVPAPGNVPSGREYSNAWTDSGGNFWLFGGDNKATGGSTIYFNDLWEFNTTTNEWTWVSGSSAQGGDQNGVYGTVGMPASTNAPGSRTDASSWTDVSGNLWLFGGSGYDHGTGEGYLNDLWEFNPSTNEWTWMAGSNTRGPGGTYGTLGIPSSTNTPGVRYLPATWRDSLGNFWMFGGEGKDANATFANLNDLWEYQPANGSLQAAATPTFSVPAGNYTSVQTVTISDATAG
ncbi:MAG: chitobiase/beta-hexosaminidase C-terminal domain-containing protein, partial [Terracidiphilus sp.]